jgi:uncharacterized sulfatase
MKRRRSWRALRPRLCRAGARRPNILLALPTIRAIAYLGDGRSHSAHPAFDRRRGRRHVPQRVRGRAGVRSSRAALLTRRHIWTLEEAGTHASLFPRKFAVYPSAGQGRILHRADQEGAGPCNFKAAGWVPQSHGRPSTP